MKIKLIYIFLFTFSIGFSQNMTDTYNAEKMVESKLIEAKKELLIGRADKAAEILEPEYEQNRENAAISFDLAKIYVVLDDRLKVEKYTLNALRRDPDNIWINVFYGNILMEYGKYEQAAKYFGKLVSLDPKNFDYNDMLLAASIKSNDPSKVEESFATMVTNFGNNKYTLNKRYEYYENTENYQKAVEVLLEITALYPDDTRYLKLLALTYQSLGDEAKADATFKKILELDPNDSDANLAMLKDIDDPAEQNHYLRALSPIIENAAIGIDAKVQELIPYTLQLQDNPKDTDLENSLLLLSEKLVLTHPTDAKGYAYYGDILFIAGNYEKAKTQYEKTLELNKKVYEVWAQYFNTLNILKDYKTLKQVANKALDYYPNQPLPYAYIALCQTYDKAYAKAEKNLEEAKFISGNNPMNLSDVYVIKSILIAEQGDIKKAVEYCEQAINLAPRNTFALKTMAKFLNLQNDIENAKLYYQKANDAGDKSQEVLDAINTNPK